MARLYKHKSRGLQLHYTIYFPDGTQASKYRHYHSRPLALDALTDAEQLERMTMRNELSREFALYYQRRRLISQGEADKLFGAAVEIPTLDDLADVCLQRSETECRPDTHHTNYWRIRTVLRYFGPDTPVTHITQETVERYREDRLKGRRLPGDPLIIPGKGPVRGVSASTVNKEIVKLAQILDVALERKAITTNPARAIKPLKDNLGRMPRALSDKEIQKLLLAAKASTDALGGKAYEIALLYLYTGMRRDELLHLEWNSVDIRTRRITVQSDHDGKTFMVKTRRARVIGMARDIVPIFEQLPREGRYVLGGDGLVEHPDSVTRAFRKIMRRAELPRDITLHSLRHTYITHLVEKGVNPRRVQYLAGHARFATTERYLHVLPSDRIEEDALDFRKALDP